MAGYNALDPNNLLPGDPITSAIMQALNENPIAISEGAASAPRIRPDALDFRLATIDPSGLANVTITDLPPANLMFEFETIQPNSGTPHSFSMSASFDNGATWPIVSSISGNHDWQSTSGQRLGGLSGFVQVQNTVAFYATGAVGSTVNTDDEIGFVPIQHAKPFAHMNAVRFSWSPSIAFRTADNQRIRVYAGGYRHAPKA